MMRRSRPGAVSLLLVGVMASGCLRDEADRAYHAALEGEETGMTRPEQVARITRAIALAPDRAWYFELRAIYRIDLHEFPEALSDLDEAIALGDRPYLRFLRGLVLCQSRRCDSALGDFELAIGNQPENTQFYRGRGLARVEVHRFDEALADGEHLVHVAPQMAESYYVRGMALQGLGRDVEAVRDFSSAMRIRPELVYPLLARARSFETLGDEAHARADRATAATRNTGVGSAPCVDPFRY